MQRLIKDVFFKKHYIFVFGAVFCIFCLAFSVHGANDLLLMPAEKSDLAPFSVLMDIVMVNGQLVAVGDRGHILYSDAGCVNWAQADVPVSVTLTSVCFPSDKKGWAVGHDGVVLHTKDGGKTWEKQLDGYKINDLMLANLKQMLATKKKRLENEAAGLTGAEKEELSLELEELEFFLSDVVAAVEEGPVWPLLDVWFKNEREGLVIGAFGMILRTMDGGKTWKPLLDRIDNPSGFHHYAITRSGDDLFIAGESGMLFRSEDFGQNWQRLESPYQGSYFGIIGSPEGGFVAAFGLRGNLFFSFDRGKTWQPTESAIKNSITGASFLSDGSICIAALDGSIYKSMDKGKTFTVLPTKIPGSITLIEMKRGILAVVGYRGYTRIDMNPKSGI